jgi:hypothetical protein
MKKSVLIICMSVLLFISCKKENQESQVSFTGYWTGSANIYHTALLVKPNGISNFYYGITGTDTANPVFKGWGSYTINGNSFRGKYLINTSDTVFLETTSVSGNLISGLMYSTFTPEILSFDLRKQHE